MKNKVFQSSRRGFLKSAGILLPLLSLSGFSGTQCTSKKKSALKDLYRSIINPASEAKPFFRWWWNGNQVNKKEISRELSLMKKAGAGGIEINPIAMPQQVVDPPKDGLEWLSDSWCEMIRYAVQEAKKLDMQADLIVGTGWPFGGEFLNPEETIQGLTFEEQDVTGPGPKVLKVEKSKELEEIFRIYLVPKGLKKIEDIVELDQRPDADNQISIDDPYFNHQLVLIRIKKGFREVFRGAPGGAGPVLDHFNAGAVWKYLNRMSDKLNPYFEGALGNGIRAVFCDSIELEGANWTTDLPSEFEKRRGYSIMPYLAVLGSEIEVDPHLNDLIQRARYDYSLTLAELFQERFIDVFHQWCHENQVLCRYQAYGHPWLYTDLVSGYMIPDIPEGDQWLYNPGWSSSRIDEIRYAIWNKYASSGGHLANRKIISSEAMTNTSGVFKATLKYLKQAADLNFIAGINHLVLHGYNYSPPEIGFPGWVQYGTYFNEHNTWWPYLSGFMEYVSRLSMIFQKSAAVSQVAILGPTPDIWRKYGLDRNPFNTEPWYLHSIWQAFSSNGIAIDFINGSIVTKASFKNGRFDYNGMSYDALMICDVASLEMPVARSILQYVEAGGKIIFLGTLPSQCPGMANKEELNSLVKSSIQRAIESGAHIEKAPDENLKGNMEQLVQWTGNLIENYQLKPGIIITDPDPYLMSVQFIHQQHPLLFFSNVHQNKFITTDISIPSRNLAYWRWDPETGLRHKLREDSMGGIHLALKPLESALIALDHPDQDDTFPKLRSIGKEWNLEGNWELECIPKIEGGPVSLTLDPLTDLSSLDNLRNFSGTAIYKKSFVLESTDFFGLELGLVYDLAEVKINGNMLGVDWYGNKTFPVNGYLVKGKNELEIRVVNTLLNYCISQKQNPEIEYWLDRYRDKVNTAPAGLIGPVKLIG